MIAACGFRTRAEDDGHILQTVLGEMGACDGGRRPALTGLGEREVEEPAGCEIRRQREIEQAALP
jgi:hypothetical protein